MLSSAPEQIWAVAMFAVSAYAWWRGGWVERSPSLDDRRAQIVTATSKARVMLKELAPRQSALEHEILQDLSADERRILLALLDRIRARLGRQ